VTYDVRFDDGDRDRRALPENVRRMGAASASLTPNSAASSLTRRLSRAQAGDGQTLAVGDRCECRFKVGRTLSNMLREMCAHSGKLVFSMIHNVHARGVSPMQGGSRYFGGKIRAIDMRQDGSIAFDISYDDGDIELGAAASCVRGVRKPESGSATAPPGASGGDAPLAAGDLCECRYRVMTASLNSLHVFSLRAPPLLPSNCAAGEGCPIFSRTHPPR
jgi:hypothetical protein